MFVRNPDHGNASQDSNHHKFHHQDFDSQLYKTRMCRFQQGFGHCRLGTSCTFAHRRDELRAPLDLRNTSMCKQWQFEGECSTPGCQYAHSIIDLNWTGHFFKKKLCSFYLRGRCTSGPSCRFSHDDDQEKIDTDSDRKGLADSVYEKTGRKNTSIARGDMMRRSTFKERSRQQSRGDASSTTAEGSTAPRTCSTARAAHRATAGHFGPLLVENHRGNAWRVPCDPSTSSSSYIDTQVHTCPPAYGMPSKQNAGATPPQCIVPVQSGMQLVPMTPQQQQQQQLYLHAQAGGQQVMLPAVCAPEEYGGMKDVNSVYTHAPQLIIPLPDGTPTTSYFIPVMAHLGNAPFITPTALPNTPLFSTHVVGHNVQCMSSSNAAGTCVQWAPQYAHTFAALTVPPVNGGSPQCASMPTFACTSPVNGTASYAPALNMAGMVTLSDQNNPTPP
eukprot:GEMP01014093.1.p1 GENE.GEMP01014093.1~~GEMP01014093.1.p1  ORF type:complete len:445 (+),score=119.46 GEMP01014093.1:1643-2977(+)